MLDQLTSAQLSEWEAYNELDPIGDWRSDFQMAYLASLMTNIARAIHGKKGMEMTSVEDFMPDWGEQKGKPVQTVEEMKEIMMGLVKSTKKKRPMTKKRSMEPMIKHKR